MRVDGTLVVHTGQEEWTAADELHALADPVPGLMEHVAVRQYTRLDLSDVARDGPRESRLDFLARLTAAGSLSDMVAILRTAAEWLRRDPAADAEDRSLFLGYLDWVKILLPQLEMPVTPDARTELKWRELMDGLTELEARSREWP
ncbi:MAG: hypothetical protein J4F45_04915, partial [Pseudomonadales bacterium]|nr:hypothetical protein [Pseudomonadales bacterium]